MNILVINCGSSTIKYKLIESESETCLITGTVELKGELSDFRKELSNILDGVKKYAIDAVGHRVVHGGDQYNDAVMIDGHVIAAIERWSPYAPLHNPNNLAGIQAAQSILPDIPHVAAFDTAFHSTLPRRAKTYAIDHSLAETHHLKRFGFHGTSHQYVSEKAAEFLETSLANLRIITLHLGNGASACAVEFGHSTETSMGLTPLEGLVMGTRSGDIDPGILIFLAREVGMSIEEIDDFLNNNSGLKGISGLSNDMRAIEKAASEGNDQARIAIAVFTHRIRKYIGAYAAVMGGVDVIVLTGGIGENSSSMRLRILQRLEFLGVVLDQDKNADVNLEDSDSSVSDISATNSRVKILVVKTNEGLKIAQQTEALVKGKDNVDDTRRIPIAVSARHVHLTQETFETLFGNNAELVPYRELSQPGQFACDQTVNLIGPKGRIDHVRILGPFRSKNQVEISRTDEFALGVDAPVRDSGQTHGSAPITLEGPEGTVHLKEGLICARRHIHMHPEDARQFNVKNNDEVEVAIKGGARELIFGDVLIRVSPSYKLEMHIDTDEANSAELDGQCDAVLVYSKVECACGVLQRKRSRLI